MAFGLSYADYASDCAPSTDSWGGILIVDDNVSIRTLIAKILRIKEFENVFTAENGREALSVVDLHDGEVDVVLTDSVMPVMDGLASVRALRARHRTIQIIAATGLPDAVRQEEMQRLGVQTFLPEPFDVPELIAALKSALLDKTNLRSERMPSFIKRPANGAVTIDHARAGCVEVTSVPRLPHALRGY